MEDIESFTTYAPVSESNGMDYVPECEHEGDLIFEKVSIDPKLVSLQEDVTGFITSVILLNEQKIYDMISKNFADKKEGLLCNTTSTIISLITEITNDYFNKLYFEVQEYIVDNRNDSRLSERVKFILGLTKLAGYEAHILLDKLIGITYGIHIDVVREELDASSSKIYMDNVLHQINNNLSKYNMICHISKGIGDDGPFVIVPKGAMPFNIFIDKNIER